tara:strand:+ start:5226 stop:5576 length:351 start_codon:yes stop_codon:yes gene_type:complete
MPRRKNVKPTLHDKTHHKSVQGEYTLVNRGGTKKFNVPLMGKENMNSIDLYKRIAIHHNVDEEMIIIEPGYYTVDNERKENPYPDGIDVEDDGYEFNARGNLVKKKGWVAPSKGGK